MSMLQLPPGLLGGVAILNPYLMMTTVIIRDMQGRVLIRKFSVMKTDDEELPPFVIVMSGTGRKADPKLGTQVATASNYYQALAARDEVISTYLTAANERKLQRGIGLNRKPAPKVRKGIQVPNIP